MTPAIERVAVRPTRTCDRPGSFSKKNCRLAQAPLGIAVVLPLAVIICARCNGPSGSLWSTCPSCRQPIISSSPMHTVCGAMPSAADAQSHGQCPRAEFHTVHDAPLSADSSEPAPLADMRPTRIYHGTSGGQPSSTSFGPGLAACWPKTCLAELRPPPRLEACSRLAQPFNHPRMRGISAPTYEEFHIDPGVGRRDDAGERTSEGTEAMSDDQLDDIWLAVARKQPGEHPVEFGRAVLKAAATSIYELAEDFNRRGDQAEARGVRAAVARLLELRS